MGVFETIQQFPARVRRRREVAAWRARHMGTGTRLAKTVQVYGWSHVRLGRNTLISDDTLLNALNCQQDSPCIVIGDSCFIGRRNFFNAGTLIQLGDFCVTATDCHFLGSDHVMDSPLIPYVAAGTTAGAAIRLGTNCWIGARVTVLKGVSIGFGSIVGASAVVTKDLPPLSIAVGHPAKVVKRFHLAARQWIPAEQFTSEMAAQIPSEEDYLAQVRSHGGFRMPLTGIGREFGDF